jgi:hypothetical protein
LDQTQDQDRARHLLERLGVLRHACDLDLLVFFARHPRTLMTSEQLAGRMGYALQQIAASLDRLLRAALITRTQNRTRAVRMYALAAGTDDRGLPSLLEFASTRHGLLAMRQALARSIGRRTSQADDHAAGARRTRPLAVRRTTDVARD